MDAMAAPPAWVTEYYALVDANDGAGALARLAPDVRLRVASRPGVKGRDAAAETLRSFHHGFASVSHEIHNVWQAGDTTICEFTATYLMHDGSRRPLPSLTVIRRDGEAIIEMRIYLDEGSLTES